MVKLKPCPFCGGEAEILIDTNCYNVPYAFVKCGKCKAETLSYIHNKHNKMLFTDAAVESWNRRYRDEQM